MTRDEMQRFLDRESRRGSTEYDALKALAEIIGITFHEREETEEARDTK